MNEVEYILRIVLRARDHMTAALAKARAEIAAFSKDVDKFDASITKLNTRISRLNTRVGNVTDKFAEWRTIMRDFGADSDKASSATDKLTKSTDDLSRKTGLITKQHKDMQKAVGDLGNKFIKLDEDFRKGHITREDYVADLDRIGKEYDKLAKKSEIGSELGRSLRNAGDVAKAHIRTVKENQAAEVRAVTEAAEAKAKAEEDAEKKLAEGRENRKNFILDLLDTVNKREEQMRQNSVRLDKDAEAERIRIEGNRQQSIVAGLNEETRARKAVEGEARRTAAATDREIKREERARIRLRQEIDQTRREYGVLNDEIQRGNIHGDTAVGNLRSMATAFRRLGSDLRVSENERREFNILSERINQTLRRGRIDVERYGHEHRSLGEAVRGAGENVATLDNRLRGIALFAAFAFAQQLISALIALGGELVAVASSAIMAGAAIGGNLAAGIAQAVPVTALLIASLQRVKQVIDAVQQANKLQQQQFVQGRRDNQKAAADTDRIANAQDSLRSATDQVTEAQDRLSDAQQSQREAQDNLNDARDEAKDRLEDLIFAEREAELAAKGAALSQKEAQEALRRAIQGGDLSEIRRAQLGILDAQLDREKSLVALRRQRTETRTVVSGGVENMDEVVRAEQQLEDARKGVEQANKAIDDANRGVERANRGLDSAKRQTTDTAGAMVTAQANLAFLLSQLSPAERRLYEAGLELQKVYRRIFIGEGVPGSGVLGVIIDSFARAVTKATEILQRPEVIQAATALADEIAKQFDRITDAFTSDFSLGQMLRIVENARENLGRVNGIVINLGKSFLNIAEAADPAFKQLIGYVDRVVGRFLDITRDKDGMAAFFLDGERHLESWLNLFGSVGNLIAAVTGAAANQGLSTVEKLTDFLNKSADRIRDNGSDVRKFFSDASRAAAAVYSVIKTLAVSLFEVFDVEHVENFANFLNKVFIPALIKIIEFTGTIANLFTSLAQNDFIAGLMKAGFIGLIGLQVGASALGVLTYFGRLVGLFKTLATAAAGTRINFGRMVGFLARMVGFLPGMRGIAGALGRIGAGGALGGAVARGGGGAAGGGLLAGLGRRGSRTNPMFVYVVNQMPGIDGPDVDSDGNTVAGGTRGRQQPRSRRSRVARGLGAAALLGGAVAISQTGGTDFRDEAIDVAGTANFNDVLKGLNQTIKQMGSSLMSFDIGGVWNAFARNIDGAGAKLYDFSQIADKDFKQAIKDRDVDRLRELAKQARENAKQFPEFAESLNRYADAADQAADKSAKTEEIFRGLNRQLQNRVTRLGDRLDRFIRPTDVIKAEDILEPNAVNQLESNFSRMRKSGVTSIGDLRKNIEFNLDQITKGFTQGSDSWYSAVSENLSASVQATVDAMDDQVISQKDGWREIRRITRNTWINIRDNIDSLSNEARDAIAGNFSSARRAIERQTGGWQKATGDALKEIRKLMRQELELYGLSPAQARNIAKGNKDRGEQFGGRGDRGPTSGTQVWGNRAIGGVIGGTSAIGQRGKDMFGTFLGRGEMVLNNFHQRYIDPAVQWFYGHPLGQTFNRIRGYHAGGPEQPGFAGGYAGKTPSGGRAVPIPRWATTGTPEFINSKVLNDALALVRRFKMVITDAFATSGHVGSGHLQTGTAMDVIPGPRGSWDLVDKAVQYARSKGLTVLYDGVPNHGRGNHAHIELIAGTFGRMVSAVRGAIRRLNRIGVGGPDSQLKNIGTAALENVRGAARRMLRRVDARMGGTAEGQEDVKGMDPDANVVSAFRRAIRVMRASPIERMALWMAGIVESHLKNLPYGDADSLGALQERVSIYGREHAMNPFASATRFLRQAQALRPWRGTAGALAQAVQRSAFPGRYDEVRSQAQKYFAHGGIVPGWVGRAIPIVAHGGEWIVNKLQQSRLAQLVGTSASALSSMLGFHGSVEGGAQGGLNTESRTVDLRAPKLSSIDRLGDITNLFMSVDDLAERSAKALRIIRRMIRETPKKIERLVEAFDILTREGGILDTLREAIDRRVNKRATRITTERFRVRGGVVTERFGEATVADKELDNLRKTREDLVKEQNFIVKALRSAQTRLKAGGLKPEQKQKIRGQINELRQRLIDSQDRVASNISEIYDAQERAIQADIDQINNRFERRFANIDIRRRRASAIGDTAGIEQADQQQRDQLTKQAEALSKQATKARRRGRLDLARTLEAQVADIQTQIFESIQQSIRNTAEQVNQTAQRHLGRNDLARRVAELFGRDTISIEQARIKIMQDQRAQLGSVYQQAVAAQNPALANEIEDQLAEIDVAIAEATQNITRTMVENINKAAERQMGRIDTGRRIAEVLGRSTIEFDKQRIEVMRTQQASLQQALAIAAADGNTTLVDEITSQINELSASIVEASQAITQQVIEEINKNAQRRLGRLDLAERMLAATGTVGLIASTALGGAQFSRSGIFEQRGKALEEQRAALQDVLRQQQLLPVDQQNVELIKDLTDQILELDVTIQENTKAAFQAKVADINASADFNLGIVDLNRQIIELQGNIAGNTDQAALLTNAQQRANILSTQRAALEQLLLEAQLAQDQEAINELTTALLQNQIALLQNTQTINELTGTMAEPQSFTSSAWRLFREAIFNGLGQVLPQYSPANLSSGFMARAGVFGVDSSTFANNNTNNNNGTVVNQDIDIEVNEAGGPIDTTALSSAFAFASKTAQ